MIIKKVQCDFCKATVPIEDFRKEKWMCASGISEILNSDKRFAVYNHLKTNRMDGNNEEFVDICSEECLKSFIFHQLEKFK